MLYGDRPLFSQVLDLISAILLPVLDVGVVSDAERTARKDDGAHVVVEAGRADGFLVGLGRASFFREDEARPDPDGGGAEHEGRG